MKSVKWLINLMLPYWPRILLALLLSALTITSHIGLMAASAYLLARAALHPPLLDLMVTIVGVRFFGLSRAVFRYLERYLSHDVTFRILSQIRVKFYQRLEPLAPARLMNFQSGDLLSRIVADVEVQQNLFLRVLAPPLVALLVLFGYGFFLAQFDVRFSFILAGCFLVAGLGIPWIIRNLTKGAGRQLVALKAELSSLVGDCLLGMTELVAFGQDQAYLAKIRRTDRNLQALQNRVAGLSALSSALTGMIANLGLWLILVLGIFLVQTGRLNGVNLGMLALGTLSSFEALFPLGLVPHHLEQNLAAADRLQELIEGEPAVKNRGGFSPQPDGLELAFQKVSFRYGPDEPWALQNLTFSIPQQSKAALVGPSGAGKTSVINLLLRFWDYNEGRIELGKHSLRDYTQEDVRSLIGVVTQRTHLFNATIRENLLMVKPEATDEELRQVTRQAKLDDFILSTPQGYDSIIGEGGFKLSGGQRQRLAIARVLLKDAPILILDEAAAGLDPLTERKVMDEIFEIMEGRTIIVITHRLMGLDKMDEILVLERGMITERGKHAELLRQNGVYNKMWETEMNTVFA